MRIMRERDFGIFSPEGIEFSDPFEEQNEDMRFFSKIRHRPSHTRLGGGGLPANSELPRKIKGRNNGWPKGPGAHNIKNIPPASSESGGPWTKRNQGPNQGPNK